eukprot:scaffold6649_cov65-Cylindrotheca_fusiformis.AAC.1
MLAITIYLYVIVRPLCLVDDADFRNNKREWYYIYKAGMTIAGAIGGRCKQSPGTAGLSARGLYGL